MTQLNMDEHGTFSYMSKIAPTLTLNLSSNIIPNSLVIFKLVIFILLFLSWLMSILLIKKASWTLEVEEKWVAMLAIFLAYITHISPLDTFSNGTCFH